MFKYAGQNTLTAASLPWLVEVIAADGIIIPASTVLGSQHPADTRESSAVVAPAPHPPHPHHHPWSAQDRRHRAFQGCWCLLYQWFLNLPVKRIPLPGIKNTSRILFGDVIGGWPIFPPLSFWTIATKW